MKKIILISVSYAVFCLLLCIGFSFYNKALPILLPSFVNGYIIRRGVLYFINFFPSLIASAFLIGCSIMFSSIADKVQVQFSSIIIRHFEHVMIYSIICIFFIMCSREVIRPIFSSSQKAAEDAPHLLAEYLNLSQSNLEKGNIQQSHEYAEYALKLDSHNEQAIKLEEKSSALKNTVSSVVSVEKNYAVSFFQGDEIRNETVSSLINKSREAASRELWFESHYYAQMAINIGSERDTNYGEAKILASQAWNKVEIPSQREPDDNQLYYRAKFKAYNALMANDNVEAYYQFVELHDKDKSDSDVVMFLDIARNRVNQQLFFIDETDNLIRFEKYVNVYFSVTHKDGIKDVIHIQGITPVKSSGGMLQYLRGFNMVSFTKDGEFMRSIHVDYAKLIAKPSSVFTPVEKDNYSIKDEYRNVPFLMFESIDRNGRGAMNNAVYEIDYDTATDFMLDERNYTVLGLSLDDFLLMCEGSVGADNMNLLSLLRFSRKADRFGFANETYGASFIRRSTYPLLFLDILIFLACLSWNYRLKNGQLFKFKWLLVFPLTSFVIYLVIDLVTGIIALMNYLFISTMGDFAILSAILTGTVIFVILSGVFLSRVSD